MSSAYGNAVMTRRTIALPEDLAQILTCEARRRDTSVSEIVRQALIAYLGLVAGEQSSTCVAVGRSGGRRTARNAEAILVREWRGHRR